MLRQLAIYLSTLAVFRSSINDLKLQRDLFFFKHNATISD